MFLSHRFTAVRFIYIISKSARKSINLQEHPKHSKERVNIAQNNNKFTAKYFLSISTISASLSDTAISSIGADSKYVIALTDGAPTRAGTDSNTSEGSSKINNDTAATATELKKTAELYTVCFGAANDKTYNRGPTVGAFLRDSIATAASEDKTYAYDADNTAELNKAFEAITQEITSGLTTGLKVTDSAGQYIDMTAPNQYVSVENAYEWTLSDPVVSTDGNTTTYTYSVSYTVKLDTTAEGFVEGKYYPTNGKTYLTYTDASGSEKTLYFEIPGVKGTAPRYTVTYNKGENGNLAGQDDEGNVKNENIRKHSATPAAPAVTADEGYYFTGWDKEIAAAVTADVTYTAQYAAKGEITVQANSATATYDGTEKSVSGFLTTEFTIDGVTYTVEGLSASAKGTAAGTYPSVVTGTAVVKDSNGTDVTKQFTVNKKDGKLTITPTETELKVVANSNSWVYDGQDHADGGYTVTFGEEKYEVKAGESATLSTGDTVTAFITKTVKHVSETAEGNNEIVRLAVENEDGYKTVNKLSGTLTITPAPLTITAGSSSQPYVDGVVMCNEYTNTPLVDGDKIESVKITGQQDGPGKSDNVPSDAVIKNAADEDVTGDYDITYVNGVLEGVPKLEKDVHFNYIMGYKDKTIRPNNNITRAEVATIFFRLLTDESREYYWKESNDFKDIPDNYWACPAISTLTNAGILKGFEDGNFRPNEPVTRAQMATIIARFANLSEGTVSFTDIEGHWAQRAIELAAGNGWINGYEDGTFRPNDKITRAATMAMINRVLDRHVENVEDLLPDMNVWSDNMDTSYTFYFDIQEATNFHECQRIDNSPNEKWTVKLEDIDWTVYEF